MGKKTSAHVTLAELVQYWKTLLEADDIPLESAYRIQKLVTRSGPLAVKMFLKTLKGREMITECARKTRVFQDQLESGSDDIYRAMTDLEATYEVLIKTAYEFRVKAG